jgi:RimJ/RimL family protein N-acetyltransferase
MTYHTTAFEPRHLDAMQLQPHQESSRVLLNHGYGERLNEAGPAFTVYAHGEPVACFGLWIKWPGTAEVWAFLAANIGPYGMLAGIRAAREIFDAAEQDRLHAYVDAGFEPGVRLMLDLGFTVEGKHARYFPDGADAFVFARVRGVVPAAFQLATQFDEPSEIAKILRLEAEMRKLPQMPVEPVHYFTHGIYAREITIPKGMLLTGKMHATAHMSTISKGDISVLTEEGVKRIHAPATIVSKPGIKRVGYAHEETVWTTYHGTHETDLDKLERELIIPVCEVLP